MYKKLLLLALIIIEQSIQIYSAPLSSGVYCIGPSSSYIPPSGPLYINGSNPYPTLTAALNDIQTNGANGAVIFELQNNYTSSSEANPISISYQGTSVNTLTIRPRSDLSGQLIIGLPRTNANQIGVLDFNGADYVTVDGTIGNGPCDVYGIIVRNTGFLGNVISFENDATHNTLKGLQVEIGFGNGVFIEYLSGSTGNDYLTFSCCKFKPRVDLENTNSSFWGIVTRAHSFSVSQNDNIIIENNYFEDCHTSIDANGPGNIGYWKITNNHFYKKHVAPSFNNFIRVACNDTATIRVEGNYFGGSAPFCGGAAMVVNGVSQIALDCSPNSVNNIIFSNNNIQNISSTSFGDWMLLQTTRNASDIIGNTFGNPNVTNDLSSTQALSFTAISCTTTTAGRTINILDNSINNVYFPAQHASVGSFNGINFGANGNHILNIKNNSIKNIASGAVGDFVLISSYTSFGFSSSELISGNIAESINQMNPLCNNLYGITAQGDNVVMTNNRIGSLTKPNNVVYAGKELKGTGGLIGIISTGNTRLDSNTVSNIAFTNTGDYIRKLYYFSHSASLASCSGNKIMNVVSSTVRNNNETENFMNLALIGITGVGVTEFNQNAINGLSLTTIANASPGVAGIVIQTGGSKSIKNAIYNLGNTATATGSYPFIIGIAHDGNSISSQNNFISLSNGVNTNGVRIFGMRSSQFYSGQSIYHNTVAISGTNSNGANSYALYRFSAGANQDNIKNNILYNIRSGGTGKHFAFANSGAKLTSDYNDLYTLNPATLAESPFGTDQTFTSWKSTSGQDAHSKNINVKFIDLLSDLHLATNTNCGLDNAGVSGTGVIDDIDNELRNTTTPDIGADEFGYNPNWASASSNSIVCSPPQNLVLNVTDNSNGLFTYSWVGPNSFTSNLAAPVISSPTAAASGAYTVTVTDILGCVSAPSSTNASVHVPPAIICPQNITVNADPGLCSSIVDYASATSSGYPNPIVSYSQSSGTVFPVGVTSILVNATNDCGVSNCSFTITVNDIQPPVIMNCPESIQVSNDAGNCSALVSWSEPAASDNCELQSFSVNYQSGGTFPVGSTTVIYTATDNHNNTQTCSFTIEVTDVESPVITCPSNMVVIGDPINCNAVVNYNAVVSDNCPGTSVEFSPPSGSTLNAGNTLVTATAMDVNGNTDACQFNVWVSVPFTFNYNINILEECSEVTITWQGGCAGWNVNLFLVRISPFVVQANVANNIANSGSYTWILPPNIPSGEYQFYIEEVSRSTNWEYGPVFNIKNTPPNVIAHDLTVNLDGSGNATINAAQIDGGSNDICGIQSMSVFPSSFNCDNIGTNNVTLTVTDLNGNTVNASAIVTVIDNEELVIHNCPDPIAVSNDEGSCSSIVTWGIPDATDNCGIQSFIGNHNSGDDFEVGTTVVMYTATDNHGNVKTCTFNIEVTDDEAPVISNCPETIYLSNDAGSCAASASWTEPTVSDNCEILFFSSNYQNGDAFPVGSTTVIYTATDIHNNTQSCTFNVVVTDAENPVITCPANLVVIADPNDCSSVVNYEALVSDNCPGSTISYSPLSGSTLNAGITTVTATAMDVNGNSDVCQFNVWVSVPFTFSYNINILEECSEVTITWQGGCAGWNVNLSLVRISPFVVQSTVATNISNSGSFTWVLPPNIPAGEYQFYIEEVSRTTNWEYGPVFNINNTSPNVMVQDLTINLDASGTAVITAAQIDGGSSDICGIQDMTVTPNTFDCTKTGVNTVILTVTDLNGNVVSKSAKVTVIDNQNPVITCPANILQYADAGICSKSVNYSASATDNCSGVNITYSPASGSSFNVGTTNVIATATDANGNSTQCSFTVEIKDIESPVITCPGNITQSADAGKCNKNVSYSANATDNCSGVNIAYSPASGSSFNVGTTNVIATATDANGNSTQCSFTVEIKDSENPVITCPVNITQSADAGKCNKVVSYTADATDNCAIQSISYAPASGSVFSVGATTVTANATDVSGNTKSCTFLITIVDNQNPVVTCPSNIVDSTSAGKCTKSVNYIASASDNCGISTIIYSPLSGSNFSIGTTTVMVTATDVNGKSAVCSFTVKINPRTEICNGIDDDCDGLIDETCANDQDGDGVSDTVDNCPKTPNANQADADCDGVGDACDVCPGGDDKIDNNHDGLPDCKNLPSYGDIIPAWKCGNNKVYVCHIPPGNPGNKQTLCISYNAVQAHLSQHGDYIGPCGNAHCGSSIKGTDAPGFKYGEYILDANEFNLSDADEDIIIYPNPAQNILYVRLQYESHAQVQIQLYTGMGIELLNQQFSGLGHGYTVIPLSIEAYSNGLYYIIVTAGGSKRVKSFSILK